MHYPSYTVTHILSQEQASMDLCQNSVLEVNGELFYLTTTDKSKAKKEKSKEN